MLNEAERCPILVNASKMLRKPDCLYTNRSVSIMCRERDDLYCSLFNKMAKPNKCFGGLERASGRFMIAERFVSRTEVRDDDERKSRRCIT